MDPRVRQRLAEKAPLVDLSELRQQVVYRMVDDQLRERASEIWLLGSFVTPGREIDRGTHRSDLDAFVVVPDWDRPQAASGMAMTASEPADAVPDLYDEVADGWSPIEGPASVMWDCDVDEAWAQIPPEVKRSLVASTQEAFFATETERRNGTPRCFDLIVGNESQLEFNRERERSEGGELVDTRIWPETGD